MSRAGPVVVGSRDKEVKAEVEAEEMIWVNKWIFDAGVSFVSRQQWCGLSS
jgi:hypothetical protein